MLRRQRDADAGVGGELMAEAVERRADRLEDPRDEIVDLVQRCSPRSGRWRIRRRRGAPRSRSAARSGGGSAATDFSSSSPIEMAERVVDALEFVDVDVDAPRAARRRRRMAQFLLQLLVEQGAVRQVGQRVVMGEMGDALLDAAALGDVLMGRDPAAVRERLVDDLDRAPVGGRRRPWSCARGCRAAPGRHIARRRR